MVQIKTFNNPFAKQNSGFTLIELLIIIIVIGIMATLVFVGYGGVSQNALATSQKNALYQAQGELKTYFANNNAYPPNAPNGTDFPNGSLPTFKNVAGVTLSYRNYSLGTTYAWCASATSTVNTSLPVIRYQSTDTDTSTGACPDFGYTLPAPYGWWKLNGNANDSSGNNFNGTLMNSPTATADAAGRANSAYSFNGINQFIDMGSASIFTGSYTKTAWIILTASNSSGNILSSNNGTCGGHAMYIVNNMLNAGHCNVWNAVSDSTPLNLGQSYFVAVSYNSTTNAMKYYRNGVLISSGQTTTQSGPTAQIGAYGSGNFFSGTIDDVRAYNIELTQTQVQQLYNLGAQ